MLQVQRWACPVGPCVWRRLVGYVWALHACLPATDHSKLNSRTCPIESPDAGASASAHYHQTSVLTCTFATLPHSLRDCAQSWPTLAVCHPELAVFVQLQTPGWEMHAPVCCCASAASCSRVAASFQCHLSICWQTGSIMMHRLPPAGLQTWPIERECMSRLTRAGLVR